MAANTPFRAAFEKAQAFHMERSPTRVCLKRDIRDASKVDGLQCLCI